MNQTPRVDKSAVFAGITSFLILYVVLALGLVFTLSLISELINSRWIEYLFRLFGLLALLLPGYVAARIAGQRCLLHGLLTGLGAAAISTLFLTMTFSWEGTYREEVWFSIFRNAGLAIVLGSLGGLLGEWRIRKSLSPQEPPGET